MPRNDREHQEQCAVIRWCELNKAKYPALDMIFAIPNGGHRHIGTAKKLKSEGVKPGVPDLFLACCNVINKNKNIEWHGLFIEMKFGKNKVSEEQECWHTKLLLFGYKVIVCYSFEEAVKEICEYLDIPFKL
jgi:hypothetical protein